MGEWKYPELEGSSQIWVLGLVAAAAVEVRGEVGRGGEGLVCSSPSASLGTGLGCSVSECWKMPLLMSSLL